AAVKANSRVYASARMRTPRSREMMVRCGSPAMERERETNSGDTRDVPASASGRAVRQSRITGWRATDVIPDGCDRGYTRRGAHATSFRLEARGRVSRQPKPGLRRTAVRVAAQLTPRTFPPMEIRSILAVAFLVAAGACSPGHSNPPPLDPSLDAESLPAENARTGADSAGAEPEVAANPDVAANPETPATPEMQATPDAPVTPGRRASLAAPLTMAERRWIDQSLAELDLRERIAQLVMVWVLGDFSNAESPAYAEVERLVREEGIGGIVMSLGSPIEVASKVNALQRAALSREPQVPLLVSSDLEPGLGRLEGGVFVPSLTSAGSATVLPSSMAIGATGSER